MWSVKISTFIATIYLKGLLIRKSKSSYYYKYGVKALNTL